MTKSRLKNIECHVRLRQAKPLCKNRSLEKISSNQNVLMDLPWDEWVNKAESTGKNVGHKRLRYRKKNSTAMRSRVECQEISSNSLANPDGDCKVYRRRFGKRTHTVIESNTAFCLPYWNTIFVEGIENAGNRALQ